MSDMASRGARGGSANERGAELRARLGAVLALAVLREDDLALIVDGVGGVPVAIQAEGDEPVDDLVCHFEDERRVFVQSKWRVTLTMVPQSPLDRAVRQFAEAVECGLRGHDLLVLACASASRPVRALAALLARRDLKPHGLAEHAERKALNTLRAVADRYLDDVGVDTLVCQMRIWITDPTSGDGAAALAYGLEGGIVAPGAGHRAARELSDVVRSLARQRAGHDAAGLGDVPGDVPNGVR
jgi:hypothetical protein